MWARRRLSSPSYLNTFSYGLVMDTLNLQKSYDRVRRPLSPTYETDYGKNREREL